MRNLRYKPGAAKVKGPIMTASRISAVILYLGTPNAGQCQTKPLPTTEWTPQARLTLARAMVSEAGFRAKRDHVAIAWVLAIRFRRWARVSPILASFNQMVASYCTGMDNWIPKSMKQRLRWIRSLNDPQPNAPKGWPTKKYGKWTKSWQKRWGTVLKRADAWFRGELSDPCRGKAIHWGGRSDAPLPETKWRTIDCGKTVNTFYRLRHRP